MGNEQGSLVKPESLPCGVSWNARVISYVSKVFIWKVCVQ